MKHSIWIVAPFVLALTACGGGAAFSPPPASSGSELQSARQAKHATSGQMVYVSNDTEGGSGPAEIDYWPVGATGNVAPSGFIGGPDTGLTYGVQGVVIDQTGELYVANVIANNILGFPADSNGDVAPNVTISGPATGLTEPVGLALDKSGNLYVVNCGSTCTFPAQGPPSVEEFAAGSQGNVAPIKTIAGSHTGLVGPGAVALSATGQLFVVDPYGNRIDVFSANAKGNIKPVRTITGPRTGLGQPEGIALTTQGMYTQAYADADLKIFRANAKGDAAPKRIIEGSHTRIEPYTEGISAGPNQSVFVVDRGTVFGGSPAPEILQFAATAKGNTAPLVDIAGSNTRLYIPLFAYVYPPAE